MNTVNNLIEAFSKLPGIGPRQAKRLVYHLMKTNSHYLNDFAHNLTNLKDTVNQCRFCFRYFASENEIKSESCAICADANRDTATMLVLEKDIDLEAFQKSSVFQGKYFILGGTLPFLEQNPEEKIRLRELLEEAQRRAEKEQLQEIIFALSTNPEGENTVSALKEALTPIAQTHNLKLTRLGRGLSTGTEIEYSDHETLRNALEGRTQ